MKTTISWILSLLLIISLLITTIIINVSNFFTADSMQKTISNIDIVHEMKKIQNSSATSENKAEISDIINMAYEEADKHAIPTVLVDEIFNSNQTKTFMGKLVGNMTDELINGNDKKPITSKDFNKLLDDNMDMWIKKSKVDISDSKKEVLLIRMKSTGAGVIDNLPTSKDLNNKIDKNKQNKIQLFLSDKVKIGLIILNIIFVLLIFFLKRKKGIWLLYLTISLLITGLGVITLGLLITDTLTYVLSDYNMSFITNIIGNSLSHQVINSGIIMLVISIILYIIFGYIKKSKSVL